ncbi:MAG: RlmE family RNA methyltransferase [Candidatus Nitrosocaldaceae archaeon]
MRPTEAKKEYYRREAKRVGYRSRAAFKLLEINNVFHIFNEGMYVVDLGCSPGGWSQVALQFIGKGKIVGIDIEDIKPLPIEFINASIEDPSLSERILNILGRKVDLILSDMAPNVSGIWSLDHIRQVDLVYKAVDLAEKILRRSGNMVVKVFEGEMFNQLREDLSKRFKDVIIFKPKASRKESSELYLICKGFKQVS